jgi:hypothetical protein
MNSIIKKLIESGDRSRFIFGSTNLFIKDRLPENINIDALVSKIESAIPSRYLQNVDVIYVGQFDVLHDREVNALYAEGAIYITNDQVDIKDMIDDIIHEIAHAVEESHSMDIYADGELDAEFVGKRSRLESLIRNMELDLEIDHLDFLDSEYSQELDNLFYKGIGYPLLSSMTRGLFVSAYACTSLREYFANGFEEFYLGDRNYLNTISPKLYSKIKNLHNEGE